MKKIIASIVCFGAGLTFFAGCGTNLFQQVSDNMSEIVEDYYFGEGESFNVSLSSGQREDPYEYNGITKKKVDFGALTIFSESKDEIIQVRIDLNVDKGSILLKKDVVSGAYMADIGKKVSPKDSFSVEYMGENVKLTCKSCDFGVSSQQALAIGVETFKADLSRLVYNNKLKAECYLRVLDDVSGQFIRNFWHFYIYTVDGESYSCVIDITSGEIVVKN